MFGDKGSKKAISLILSGVLSVSMIAPGLAFADGGNNNNIGNKDDIIPNMLNDNNANNNNNNNNANNNNNNKKGNNNAGNDNNNAGNNNGNQQYNEAKVSKHLKKHFENLKRVSDQIDSVNQELKDAQRKHEESQNKLNNFNNTDEYTSAMNRINNAKDRINETQKQIKSNNFKLRYFKRKVLTEKDANKIKRMNDRISELNQNNKALYERMETVTKLMLSEQKRMDDARHKLVATRDKAANKAAKLITRKTELVDKQQKLLNNKELQKFAQHMKDINSLKAAIKKVNPNLNDKVIDEIIKFKVAKEPKGMMRRIKDGIKAQVNVKMIMGRMAVNLALQYAKGYIVHSVKEITGVDLVGKTYSYAEMASLVDSISSSVDAIQENIKIAKEEFSNMMAETAYRDFVQCATNLRQAYAGIQNALEGAAVWGRYKAGDNCTDEAVINKYANEALAEFLNGRYDYVDSLIMNYIEFKNRLTTSFTNNGKTIIDLVDEAADKKNDVFKATAMQKYTYRESLRNISISVAVLVDCISKASVDLSNKYRDASAQVVKAMDDTNKFIDAKSIIKKYGLKVTKGANGKETCDELVKPYLVSKKSFANRADYLNKNPFYWVGMTGKVKGSTRTVGADPEHNVVVAPFPKMINAVNPRIITEVIRGERIQLIPFVGMYIEDFKNSDAPCYRKWNDAYLGKDDVLRLLSNKPANVNFKDYLVKNLGFDLGNAVDKARYLVVDCLIDYTYHRFQRDDFEMRLSYFDMQTGKYLQNQVVCIADLSHSVDNVLNIEKDWMHKPNVNPFCNKKTKVSFRGILAGKEEIVAIPFGK